MKYRYTYTVVREVTTRRESEEDIQGHCDHVQDEAGEFLYGGSPGSETITVKIEVSRDNGKTWKERK